MSPVFLFKKLSNYHWPGNSFKGFFVFCNIYFFKNVLTEFYVHMEKVDITSYPAYRPHTWVNLRKLSSPGGPADQGKARDSLLTPPAVSMKPASKGLGANIYVWCG